MAINSEILEKFLDQFGEVFKRPDPASREELKSLFSTLLTSALSRMNLVTREEFDAQTALLARTRAKLESLERALEALEAPEQ